MAAPFLGVSFWRHGTLPEAPGIFSGSPDKPSSESGILPGSWRNHPPLSGMFSGSRERRPTASGDSSGSRPEPPEAWCVFSGSPETVLSTAGIFLGSPDEPPIYHNRRRAINSTEFAPLSERFALASV